MGVHDRLNFLSEEVGTSIHSTIIEHILSIPVSSRKGLVSEIIFYSDFLIEIIKSKSIERNNNLIKSILINISQNYTFRTSQDKHRVIVNLIKKLIEKKIIESNLELDQSLNEETHINLKSSKEKLKFESKRSDYGIFLKEIDIKLSGSISIKLKEYILRKYKDLNDENRRAILNFTTKIQSHDINWAINADKISSALINENIEILNTNNSNLKNTKKSRYTSIREFLESLRNNGHIPVETYLPKFKNNQEETTIKNSIYNDLTVERIKRIKKEINKKACVALDTVIRESSKAEQLIKTIDEHIKLLKGILNNFEDELVKLDSIHSSICKKYSYSTALDLTVKINKLILIIYGEFNQKIKTPIKNIDEYNNAKIKKIATKINNEIKTQKTLDSDLTDTLKKLPSDIKNRINEHINSYKTTKVVKRQASIFINSLLYKNKEWYNEPDLIHHELELYKSKLIKENNKNTAYGKFQSVLVLFRVLRRHRLIPKKTILPNSIKREKN